MNTPNPKSFTTESKSLRVIEFRSSGVKELKDFNSPTLKLSKLLNCLLIFSLCLCVCVVCCGFAVSAEAQWRPRVGEKFTYTVHWMGIAVGTATLSIKEIVPLNNKNVYHIVASARSNKFLSMIYRVRDETHTYIDVDGLFPWRFEKHQREGNYRSDEVMEYDHINKRATYKSLLNNTMKEMDIPYGVQDALSCLYYFRALPSLEIGKPVFIDVNADEKNWSLEVNIIKEEKIEMLNLGAWDTILVEPKARFRGIFAKKGRIWINFSSDDRRIPLLMKVRVPKVGLVVVALKKIDYSN